MKKITAKFNSKCAETGKAIKKGDTMYYDYSTKQCYCLTSQRVMILEGNIDGAIEDKNARDEKNVSDMIQANEEAYFDNWYQQNY